MVRIKLNKRQQTKNGNYNLELVYYYGCKKLPDGKYKVIRETRSLQMFLYAKPKTEAEKEHNRETWIQAQAIESQKRLDEQAAANGLKKKVRGRINFLDYYESLVIKPGEKRTSNKGTSALMHFKKYIDRPIVPASEITEELCEGFKEYLSTQATKPNGKPLSKNSANHYFNQFKGLLKRAAKDRLIFASPAAEMDPPKREEVDKPTLTFEDIAALIDTDCYYQELKVAFLFSCLTGLRWSDCKNLQWKQIVRTPEGWRVITRQQKTKRLVYTPVINYALQLIGDRRNEEDLVISGLKYSHYTNNILENWILRAGIRKQQKVTFHCARHTFGTLHELVGTRQEVTQHMMGHTSIEMTKRYAKIAAALPQQAASNFETTLNEYLLPERAEIVS